jgi:two-component system phosphate regulon sensor histidine kinase PhoR
MSEKLRGALDELRSEREDLSRIVTSLPVGVILLDDAKKVRYINGVAVSLLDIRPAVEPGVPAERILPAADIYTLIEESVAGKDACLELDIPGSRRRFLRICARRTATGTLLVLTDLTEERALEQSGGTSSPTRARTPDAAPQPSGPPPNISSRKRTGSRPRRTCLATIIEQQERMTKLVDDLLLLSRVEGQPPRDDPEPVDLSGVVSQLVNELRAHPLAGAIRIEADIIPGRP